MNKLSLNILRISLGIFILQNPEGWSALIKPWAENLLISSPKNTMIVNGALDVIIGIALILNFLTWIFAALAAIHLLIILIFSGIDSITARDIGLLGASIALVIEFRIKKT